MFRADRRRPAAAMLAFGGLAAACTWIGLRGGIAFAGGGAPAWLAWWTAPWLGLFGLLALDDLRKASSPDAWVAIAASDGLWLQCRSYRNLHLGTDDKQLLRLSYGDITGAREHRRSWTTADDARGAARTGERRVFIELDLGATDTGALRELLARERTLPAGRGRWNHFPVTLEPGNRLRVEWRARPGPRLLLDLLRRRGVRIEAPRRSDADLGIGAGPEAMTELARRGDLLALVQLLRVHEGLDLEAAKRRGEEMIAGAQRL